MLKHNIRCTCCKSLSKEDEKPTLRLAWDGWLNASPNPQLTLFYNFYWNGGHFSHLQGHFDGVPLL